ncbi:MAG: B12-binding domain-containing radical SAM protein [Armatimonadota bacterium]
MSELIIDYIVADRPPNPSFPWHKTGIPPLNISLLKAMTPPELDGYYIEARCHHERTMGRYDVSIARPDILALSVYTPGARRAYELATESRQVSSWQGRRIRTLAGGHHATALPLEAMQQVDSLVRGETSPALLATVLRWLIRHIEMDSEEKRVFELSPAIVDAVMPQRPIADRSWYDPSRYYMRNGLQTSLGCPFACHFCATNFAEGALFRPVDYTVLDAEVATLRRGGITALIDENLLPTSQSEHAHRVCEVLRKYHIRWQAALTACTLHPRMRELVPLFARSGCQALFFGFESLHGGMGKSEGLDDYAELIRCCHDYGIVVIGAFVFGAHAEEDASIFERTAEWATRAQIDMGYFSLNTPFPGAQDFEKAVREGLILDWNWEHYDSWYPVRRYPGISAEEAYTGIRNVFRWFYAGSAIRHRAGERLRDMISGRHLGRLPRQLRSALLPVVVDYALGTSRVTQWRLGMPYEEYLEHAIRTPNPQVLAQFAEGKPIGQFNPQHRVQELRGHEPSRTASIVGDGIPVTAIGGESDCHEGSICAS